MCYVICSRYGKIEGVKILPQRYPNIGLAAFIDFFDVKGAIEAKEAKHKIGNTELRTNFKTKAGDKFDRREGGNGGTAREREKNTKVPNRRNLVGVTGIYDQSVCVFLLPCEFV